jgi:hypothetical protein
LDVYKEEEGNNFVIADRILIFSENFEVWREGSCVSLNGAALRALVPRVGESTTPTDR